MFLGIEIGGTKLQLGIGRGDGRILALWRGSVAPASGGEGIRAQIATAVPALLTSAAVDRATLKGVGVGFGGPTDDATQTVIRSHHIDGWDRFPLAAWVTELLDLPSVICNDADVAGLAEARFGAGRGMSPVFYVTVGTGIGGGLIVDGEIYRGLGKGASEIGHLRFQPSGYPEPVILESLAAGWGIEARANELAQTEPGLRLLAAGTGRITGKAIAAAAREGNGSALAILDDACRWFAEGICAVIALLCPRRVVVGGGVSLAGEELFFVPVRRYVNDRVMRAFAGLTDIVPAALGEEVVVHGALALAQKRFGG